MESDVDFPAEGEQQVRKRVESGSIGPRPRENRCSNTPLDGYKFWIPFLCSKKNAINCHMNLLCIGRTLRPLCAEGASHGGLVYKIQMAKQCSALRFQTRRSVALMRFQDLALPSGCLDTSVHGMSVVISADSHQLSARQCPRFTLVLKP